MIYIKRPSSQGEFFFDETVEYKWWVWVLDWWALIIMHIRPSLTRMHAPRAGCCAVLPSAGLYTSWQFGRLPSEYLATRRILWRYQFSGKCHNVFYSDLRELLEWETWLVVRNSFRVDPVRAKQWRRLQISGWTSVICSRMWAVGGSTARMWIKNFKDKNKNHRYQWFCRALNSLQHHN